MKVINNVKKYLYKDADNNICISEDDFNSIGFQVCLHKLIECIGKDTGLQAIIIKDLQSVYHE